MTTLSKWNQRYLAAHNVAGLEIPFTAVKFYEHGAVVPPEVRAMEPKGLTLTSCQATKQASLGDAVCLTRENIGCVAAAISLGLVDQHQQKPVGDSLVYTEIMRDQSGEGDGFVPPSPEDFTTGQVYACAAAGRSEFALFGDSDTGRFKDVATAQQAVSDMIAIQPATMQAVFLYPPDFDDVDVIPDVVVLSVRPVELTRLIQGYGFATGKRLDVSMGGLRMVNSDLIARPYLTGEINASPYCLGARLIAQFGPDRMGVGAPWDQFQMVVEGMEASTGGYPFELYPGADPAAARMGV
ncbi:MAG: DUF169 domain-containing protein [Deltaproteobacteria bacterium]|nr:DUF169 domain-containing protein [Deltaproteobacteria bacterium]